MTLTEIIEGCWISCSSTVQKLLEREIEEAFLNKIIVEFNEDVMLRIVLVQVIRKLAFIELINNVLIAGWFRSRHSPNRPRFRLGKYLIVNNNRSHFVILYPVVHFYTVILSIPNSFCTVMCFVGQIW